MTTKVKKEDYEKKHGKRGPMDPEHKRKIGEGVSRARRAKRNQAANLGSLGEGSLEASLASTLSRLEQVPWSYSAPQQELDLAGKLGELLGKFTARFGGKGK